ncbi:MAG TPA: transposase [Baekduia sp.]|nr:transposase [Baekduia sp.]
MSRHPVCRCTNQAESCPQCWPAGRMSRANHLLARCKNTTVYDRARVPQEPGTVSKRYPTEFRRDAVALVNDGGDSIPGVAERLGVAVQSLRNWVKEAEETIDGEDPARGLDESERDELRRLRGRVRVLTRERDILKQALALMASNGDNG